MSTITLRVLGEPVGKGRPRFNRQSGRAFTPKKTRAWEQVAAGEFGTQWAGRAPLAGPVSLKVTALFSRPAYMVCDHTSGRCKCEEKHPQREQLPHLKAPDLDNIVKAVGDALQLAGVVEDDKLVSRVEAVKLYTAVRGQPRVEVRIEVAS